jgi:hypothetical protein
VDDNNNDDNNNNKNNNAGTPLHDAESKPLLKQFYKILMMEVLCLCSKVSEERPFYIFKL